MFTTFSLKKENPLTHKELMALFRLVELYQNTPQGRWLLDLPWALYKFYWCEAMRNGAVMGAYAPSKGRSIFLQPHHENGKSWLECIASTIIHELRHAWQYERNPAKYIASSLPLVRELTLERDAKAIDEKARPFFERVVANRAKRAFEERIKKNEN